MISFTKVYNLQLHMLTPWLSVVEDEEEMNLKMQIAKSKHDATLKYKFRKKRAQVWHRATLETQVTNKNISIDTYLSFQ